MPLGKPSEALRFDLFANPEARDVQVAPTEQPARETSAEKTAAPREPGLVARHNSGPEGGASSESALTVSELYERINLALRLYLPDEVWVIGEIRKVSVHRNGHRFIELADHTSAAAAAATVEVACWSRDWPTVAAELDGVGIELAPGLMVRILCRVGIWEGASRIRLTMTALDVEALVGGIAAARRRLIGKLRTEGLFDANRRLAIPLVPMRIGVVTSAGSEAYRDFSGTLQRSGFAFALRLENSLVQGPLAPAQISAAVQKLQRFRPDLIVVVRGGGARGDLAAFDSEPVARAIASSRVPVWTGIGHTGDLSVADEISQRSLVTPTACAEAVIDLVMTFANRVDLLADEVVGRARRVFEDAEASLDGCQSRLSTAARHQLDSASLALRHSARTGVRAALLTTEKNAGRLESCAERLVSSSRHCLAVSRERVAAQLRMLEAYDPGRQLARGWTLTRASDGRILRSAAEVQTGEIITTVMADGDISSEVRRAIPRPGSPIGAQLTTGQRSEREADEKKESL